MKTGLYRHYDKDNNLLYVGISISSIARFGAHKSTSTWAYDSVKMTTEWFETRHEAQQAEKDAITKECPIYNIQHNTGIANGEVVITRDGSKVLFLLSRENQTARVIVDWLLTKLSHRTGNDETIIQTNWALQQITNKSINTITAATIAAEKLKIIRKKRLGFGTAYMVNRKVAYTTNIPKTKYSYIEDIETSLANKHLENEGAKTSGLSRDGRESKNIK